MAFKLSLACQQRSIIRRESSPCHAKVWQPGTAISFSRNRCGDSMAPSIGSRKLICFYCGRKSPIRQDGTIREWECRNCEAVNYLDENGEITDPPVATVEEVPSTVQYVRRSESPSFSPSPSDPDNALFCSDCLKNQHLVRSSLAQYVPEEEDTLAVDRNYLKFKESLEKRYPQVCEDCLPRVVNRLKQSSYTAKTDHLRRLLDRTRQTVAPKKTKKSWLDVFDMLGRTSWMAGIFGQLVLNLVGISGYLIRRLLDISTSDLFSSDPLVDPDLDIALSPLASWTRAMVDVLDHDGTSMWSPGYYGVAVRHLSKWSLLLSFISIWWNPKFKEGYRGYHRHIKGFQDWYKYQTLLLIARAIFWLMMKYDLLNRVDKSAIIGLHIFMLGFTISVTAAARKCFKIDFGQLFAPTSPERLLPYVGRKEKSKYDGNDMSQALTSILKDSPSSAPVSSASQVDPFYSNNLSGMSLHSRPTSRYETPTRNTSEGTGWARRSPSSDPRDLLGISRTLPSLAEMTPDESLRYLSTGEVPTHMQGEAEYDGAQDVMEWKSHSSQHRAFRPAQAPRQSQLFSQAPVVPDQSPFWYKGLPPAPISQAHKARNPPNAPRLQPRSQEAKQNFFDRVTGRLPSSLFQDDASDTLEIEYPPITPRREIEFAQQKFFPPTAPDAANGLSEMFEQAFTLRSSEGDEHQLSSKPAVPIVADRKTHIFTALFLLVAFLGWNFSMAHPNLEALRMIPMGLMVACGIIALRSVADWANMWWKSDASLLKATGAILAIAQTLASGYAISEILAGRTYCNTCRFQGAFLLGVMLVQEVCFVAFSRRLEGVMGSKG